MNDSTRIPLGKDRFALVDAADADLVLPYRWYYASGYAQRSVSGSRHQSLHRLLAGLTPGDKRQVDHINGDGLDNRRANLRVCTAQENRRNHKARSDSVLGFTGVMAKSNGTFTAQIAVGGFRTAEDAARYRDEFTKFAHGPFARLNFPTTHVGKPAPDSKVG